MKQRSVNFSRLFGILILCFGLNSMALDFTYQTFLLSPSQAKILNKTSAKEDSLLFVANSKDGILYAGNRNLGRCIPLFENDPTKTQEPTALKDGTLQCKNLALKVEDGAITGALTTTQNLKLNLKLIDSMILQQQEVTYQYPKDPKQSTNALTSIQFYCSKDSKAQEILQQMYKKSFDCKSAKSVFLNNAQDSMQNFFKEFSQTENKSEEKVIEKFLNTSSFEQQKGDFLYYFNNNLIVFLKNNYLYTGGAHGISSQWGVILSKENGIIPLNTMIDFNNAELKSLLWQEYQNYLKSVESEAFVDFESFKVSEAILLDYDSFIFIYQPYEIMPYANGIIKLKIPLEQMVKLGNFEKTPLESLFVP